MRNSASAAPLLASPMQATRSTSRGPWVLLERPWVVVEQHHPSFPRRDRTRRSPTRRREVHPRVAASRHRHPGAGGAVPVLLLVVETAGARVP